MTVKANAGEGSLFLSKGWAELLREVYGIEPLLVQAGPVYMSMSLVKSRIFGNRIICAPFSDYGGLAGPADPRAREAALGQAVKLGFDRKVDFMEIRTPPESQFSAFEHAGFDRRDDYVTFILDLRRSEHSIFGSMDKRVRNDINKSRKQDIEFRDAESEDDVRAWHEIYLKTMRRIGSPPQSLDFFLKLLERFGSKRVCIRLAGFGGKAVSGCLFFLNGKTVNYSYSCSITEHRELRASDGLLFDSIMHFRKLGFDSFDFGRTRPGSGVYAYKMGWGGEAVKMPYFYKFYKKKLEKRQEESYERYSKLWRKYVPGFMAKRLGPWLIRQIG